MFDDQPRSRVPTKRPVGRKQLVDRTTTSVESISADSLQFQNISINTLQDVLSQSNIKKHDVIKCLKNHISFLMNIRQTNNHKFKNLEENCHRTIQANPITANRRVTFENDAYKPTLAPPPQDQYIPSTTVPQTNIKNQINLIKSHQKRMNSDSTTYEPHVSKNMNSSTIWNNINKFFTVTPTVEFFRKILTDTKPPDTNIQLGPHYSISVNQKLKLKYKNGNVQLRLPSSIVETPEQTNEISPTVVFHRLLASFVPLDDSQVPENIQRASNPNLNFATLSPEMYPVNQPGTSSYSLLPFEQKLVLEVHSIGLVPDGSGPKLTDNEVMNDIMEKTQEYQKIIDENNKQRQRILKILLEKEPILLERAARAKKWGQVVIKPETVPKNNQKRPKKRDKLA